jgi:hypothetical protein
MVARGGRSIPSFSPGSPEPGVDIARAFAQHRGHVIALHASLVVVARLGGLDDV